MNRAMITLRGWLRDLGITPILGRMLDRVGFFGGGEGYEEQFSQRLLSEVRPGDIVWEVGANLGIYTRQFCERVGDEGRVVAFEPTPACFDDLGNNCRAELERKYEIHQLALGLESGTVRMQLADDPLGATHSVLTEAPPSEQDWIDSSHLMALRPDPA